MVDSHILTSASNHSLLNPDLTEQDFVENLPYMLVSLLERRYLSTLNWQNWKITLPDRGNARPLMREVIRMGRPKHPGEWVRAMPHLLTACHEPGHALVMALQGDGSRHRLYMGARRLAGSAIRSTDDYLSGQESAFKAFFTGLEMKDQPARLDSREMPEMAHMLETAPVLAAITGISSGRGGAVSLDLQSFDRLVDAVGNHRYTLMVVAEPLEPWIIDQTLDTCRRFKSEVHSYIRRTISESSGETEGISRTEKEKQDDWLNYLPMGLFSLAAFVQLTGLVQANALTSVGFGISSLINQRNMENSHQVNNSRNWSKSSTVELFNSNAEACKELLDQHIRRLQSGRSGGWWRTAVYVAAENDAALHSVTAALRSLCAGDDTHLDPIRVVYPPDYLVRAAMESGQILDFLPSDRNQAHPLGHSFDMLGTCLNSEELAVLVNMPQREIPGLSMRDHASFALSVPSPTSDSITLGSLQDGLERNLGSVTLPSTTLNRHVFVTGMTGYGKTNTCMNMLVDSYSHLGIPFLVLEPAKAEYRRLVQMPELQGKLRVYSVGGESPLPLRLNPLRPIPGIPLGRHIDLLKAVFNASFPMFAGMNYVLEEALLEVFLERGWSLYTSDNAFIDENSDLDARAALTPCLEDLYDKIDVVLTKKKYGQETHQNMSAALRARLRSLMVGNKGIMLNTRRSTPVEDLLRSPTVIELQNMGDDEEKAFVMALLFVLLYEYAEIRQRDIPAANRGRLQHLTLIEEAHRLLQATRGSSSAEVADPRGKAVSMFTDMLAEMRAYGEGFIIADQSPTKLVPETLKNSNLKIIHRLTFPDDRQAAGSCMNLTEWQQRHLNNLKPGQAVVHDERIGEAVLVKVNPMKDNQMPDVSEEKLRHLVAKLDLLDRQYLYRHAGCIACPSPCNYYYLLNEHQWKGEGFMPPEGFFEGVLLDDINTAWAYWQKWRDEQEASMDRVPVSARIGLIYCTLVQTAYQWLTELLTTRYLPNKKGMSLTPVDRLKLEEASRAVGKLFLQWTENKVLDESAQKVFAEAQSQLQFIVAEGPPHMESGCVECPSPCTMRSFVVKHLTRFEKQVNARVAGILPLDRRINDLYMEIVPHVSLLQRYMANPKVGRHWLYCLLSNSPLSMAAEEKRMDMLNFLREVQGSASEGVERLVCVTVDPSQT